MEVNPIEVNFLVLGVKVADPRLGAKKVEDELGTYYYVRRQEKW